MARRVRRPDAGHPVRNGAGECGRGRSERLRLVLSGTAESLLNLWGRVGYEYHRERTGLRLAVQYLKHKERHLAGRKAAAVQVCLRPRGAPARNRRATRRRGESPFRRARPLFTAGRGPARCRGFPAVRRLLAQPRRHLIPRRHRLGTHRIHRGRGEFRWPVYDFTVNHPDHNFVANGFVVSNCGVRLVRSNLFYREVKHPPAHAGRGVVPPGPDRRRQVGPLSTSTPRS